MDFRLLAAKRLLDSFFSLWHGMRGTGRGRRRLSDERVSLVFNSGGGVYGTEWIC